MIRRRAASAALIATLAMLALGATRVDAALVAQEVSDDFLITHVLNVPLAFTKLLVDRLQMSCRLTAGSERIRTERGSGLREEFGVNNAGAVSRTASFRLRIVDERTRAPYQGSVAVRCEVRPSSEGQFRVGEPPVQQAGAKPKDRHEFLQPGPTVTPDGAIAVEGTFP
jgi:hypothetical protein